MPHHVCGPEQNRSQKVSHWGLHACAGVRARHSENLFLIHNIHVIAFADCANEIVNIFPQIPIIGTNFPNKIF